MQSNCWAGSKNLERHKIYWDLSQLLGMGSYDHQAKDQGVFP